MAKKKITGGPFLSAAIFCEGILEDMQGSLSVQRIIDGIQILIPSHAPLDVPSKENPVEIKPNILLILRTGDSPGKHTLKLMVEQPNGKRSEAMSREVDLPPEAHGGLNVKTNTALRVFSNGVFWIDVLLDDTIVTRMPLNIVIKREENQEKSKKSSK